MRRGVATRIEEDDPGMSEAKAEAAKAGEAGADGKAAKKKNPLMLIGILAGVLVVLLGGSFFLITKLTAPPAAEATEDEAEHGGGHGGKKGKKGAHAKVGKFEVKDLILNTGEAGSARFVKVGVAIEFDDPKMAHHIEEKEYRIRDVLITLIGHRTAAELGTAEARDELRLQILDELNGSIGDGHITEVFFTDFIIQ